MLDFDGVTQMYWDERVGMYRSPSSPFHMKDANGADFWFDPSGAGDEMTMMHPRVWDFFMHGHPDYVGCTTVAEYIALLTGNGNNVSTVYYPELEQLYRFLASHGVDLTPLRFTAGMDRASIEAVCGSSLPEEVITAQDFGPYEPVFSDEPTWADEAPAGADPFAYRLDDEPANNDDEEYYVVNDYDESPDGFSEADFDDEDPGYYDDDYVNDHYFELYGNDRAAFGHPELQFHDELDLWSQGDDWNDRDDDF
ncbi:MAG: hypothetical protein IJH04_10740 [Eggerthellaceae bacterium]|nr:hypothetical protein [Eggerthellaceae bacterium]